ncbi:MAG: zf-HC2 domain-containing protein [Synergistaceae bacterium]|nr:zf-HC2 domain-containing protein [Synergistaceae bacterium]
MKDENVSAKDEKISCFACEALISRACDNECSPEELGVLRDHVRECPECRRTLYEYRELSDLMTARLVTLSCPSAPKISIRYAPLRIVVSPKIRRNIARIAALAACVALFVAGDFVGTSQAKREIAMNMSPIMVATPSMWASRGQVSARAVSMETEQPFTDSINRYRVSIAEEMRKGDVDWMRVRELVEAMGELRTDLELLTIHMAYLDISTGNSPYEVAAHWENLGGLGGLLRDGEDNEGVVSR